MGILHAPEMQTQTQTLGVNRPQGWKYTKQHYSLYKSIFDYMVVGAFVSRENKTQNVLHQDWTDLKGGL